MKTNRRRLKMRYKGRLLKMFPGDGTVRCRIAIQFASVAGQWRRMINPTARKENQRLTILLEQEFYSDYWTEDKGEILYACVHNGQEEWDFSTTPLPTYLTFEADILPFYPERDWVWKAQNGVSIKEVWIKEECHETKASSVSDSAHASSGRVDTKPLQREGVEEAS
jgi:hypothetical protein